MSESGKQLKAFNCSYSLLLLLLLLLLFAFVPPPPPLLQAHEINLKFGDKESNVCA